MKKIICLSLCIVTLLGLMNISYASEGVSGLVTKSWDVVNTIAWCGYAVAFGMVIYIGIKYMLGSVDSKANMKSVISSYLIGAALVFMASTIARVVVGVAAGNDNSSNNSGFAQKILDAAKNAASDNNNDNTNTK